MALILGIETTCDETAAAVVQNGWKVLSSVVRTQFERHAKFGGVVPEIASRAHLESLNDVVEEALRAAGVDGHGIDAVAVANSPGLIGCLLVGVSSAKALAFAWEKPLVAVNHAQAHLYSVMLHEEKAERKKDSVPLLPESVNLSPRPPSPHLPAIGLVISGGHTSLYLVKAFDHSECIGSTHDDAVGEAFDKVAAILQLGYPGGPLIDELARDGNAAAIEFPLAMLEKDSLDFSFSGIKTAVLYRVNGAKGRARDASTMNKRGKADVAASFQHAAARMLTEKCRRAIVQHRGKSLIVGGGVSANSVIRAAVQQLGATLGVPVFIPPMPYCTDNAAMIAGLGNVLLAKGEVASLALEAVPTGY